MSDKHLVLVEDDEVIRESYAEILEENGFRVETFDDHEKALAAMRQALPDLAILDISLYGRHDAGFELCQELRSLSATLPIIFLTSRDNDSDKARGLSLGADDYMIKSIDLTPLVARIKTLLQCPLPSF